MTRNYSILAALAAVTVFVSGAVAAQTEAMSAAQEAQQEAAAAQAEMRAKMDAATAADDKFHANRTEANMRARDQAEAEATAAIEKSHTAADRARALQEGAAGPENPMPGPPSPR